MSLSSRVMLDLAVLSSLSRAKEVGYFNPSSCADSKGFTTCYENVDARYTDCIKNHCFRGDQSCWDSCGGSILCMEKACPGPGTNCIKACECERSTLQIDCVGQSCWNQYQNTAMDFLNICTRPNRKGLPFWPAPDDAPGSCACNFGIIDLQEDMITNQITECSKNSTNFDHLFTVGKANDYIQACFCCGYGAIISAIWDTCPDNKPSLVGADEWFTTALNPGHWEKCGPFIEKYDCAGGMGVGRADAGGNTKSYQPSSMPRNGTKTLSNVGGVVSAPVSGATFTWTVGSAIRSVVHTVTVSSADATVTGTKASSGSTGATATSSPTSTAESDAKPGTGSSLIIPAWTIAGSVGALKLLNL